MKLIKNFIKKLIPLFKLLLILSIVHFMNSSFTLIKNQNQNKDKNLFSEGLKIKENSKEANKSKESLKNLSKDKITLEIELEKHRSRLRHKKKVYKE
jgi:hypothetical protein